jgi:D(-)-tartrate dehydratase
MRFVDVRESTVPLSSPGSNAVIDFSEMTVSVVALVTDQVRDGHPVVGFGFNSNGRYGQGGLLRERFIPRLLRADPRALLDEAGRFDPGRIWNVLMRNEKPGGHGERSVAVGVLDMAVWDALAKLEGMPLNRLLAERYGGGTPAADRVWAYAAGGYYYPGKDLERLRAEMRGYLDLGYTTVKMKIGGASITEDRERIEAVLDALPPGASLAVDANGRFGLEGALSYAEMLADYGLFWYEEPCDPLDFQALAEVASRYPAPLATGENLFSTPDARNLIRYAGLRSDRDVLQMDPALGYGLVEYLRTLDMLREAGWSTGRCVPHGGHQLNLNIASGLGLAGCESYPGVFEPFGGFADGYRVERGYVGLPASPGIGLEEKASLYPTLKALIS